MLNINLKDGMDYVIPMMSTYICRRSEWLNDWTTNVLRNSQYSYTFFWMVERLKDWLIIEFLIFISYIFWLIESLQDWTIIESKIYKITFLKDRKIERLYNWKCINGWSLERLKDWMIWKYITRFFGSVFWPIEWLNDWKIMEI